MKKLFTIIILAATLYACQSPTYIYDKCQDEYVTPDEYYDRHPEENPELIDLVIVIQ